MVYMGSKRRIKKKLVPILQDYIDNNNVTTYIEPMVGGGNIIDSIKCENRFGYDVHPYLIELLKHVSENDGADIPLDISREEYYNVKDHLDDYPMWYAGLVGFCASYSGKWMAGYASCYRKNGKSRASEMLNNIRKQAPLLKGIQFDCRHYKDIPLVPGSLVYLDPPYRNTTSYNGAKGLDYEELYDWLREASKTCKVFVSEYQMPDDFKLVAEFPQLTQLCDDKSKQFVSIEKVFTL